METTPPPDDLAKNRRWTRNKLPEKERKALRGKRRYAWSSNSIMRVIRVYCEHCQGNLIRRVIKCRFTRCPLWPWRIARTKNEGFRLAQDELIPAELKRERALWLAEHQPLSELEFPDVSLGEVPPTGDEDFFEEED